MKWKSYKSVFIFSSPQSFYLPGSADEHDKQLEDWNLKAPPLYLWSRRDWTFRHNEIARRYNHIFQQKLHVEGNNVRNSLMMEEGYGWYQDYYSLYASGESPYILDGVPDVNNEAEPGAGSYTHIHRDDTDIDRKNNLNEMESDGRGQTKRSVHGNLECSTPDEESIDLEFSSPTHSPTGSKALREDFGTPEIKNTEKGCTDKEKRPGQDFPIVSERGGVQTGYSTVAESSNSFPADTNLGNYWWHSMNMQSHGYSGSFNNHFGQGFYADGRQLNGSENWEGQQYIPAPVLQTNSSQEYVPQNLINSEFQQYGSSSYVPYPDYSGTPMASVSGSYGFAYQPEHAHPNKT